MKPHSSVRGGLPSLFVTGRLLHLATDHRGLVTFDLTLNAFAFNLPAFFRYSSSRVDFSAQYRFQALRASSLLRGDGFRIIGQAIQCFRIRIPAVKAALAGQFSGLAQNSSQRACARSAVRATSEMVGKSPRPVPT